MAASNWPSCCSLDHEANPDHPKIKKEETATTALISAALGGRFKVAQLILSRSAMVATRRDAQSDEAPSAPVHNALVRLMKGSSNPMPVSITADAVDVIATHPNAAQEADEDGNLALHLALEKQPPVALINLLLKHHFVAAEDANRFSMLPLHVGLKHKAPSDAVVAVLAANPAAAKQPGSLGLMRSLPLHFGIENDAPTQSLLAVLDAYPDAAKHHNKGGEVVTADRDGVFRSTRVNGDDTCGDAGRRVIA